MHALRIAELSIPSVHESVVVRDWPIDVEIVNRDGYPAVRVLKASSVGFPDGTRFDVKPQERAPSRMRDPSKVKELAIVTYEASGHSPLFLPHNQAPDVSPILQVTLAGMTTHRPRPMTMTLTSPSLENLGLNRFRVGPSEVVAETPPKRPVTFGRHRLNLRITRSEIAIVDRQMFIAVEPPVSTP